MTPSLEGWPTKAKEVPSPNEVRLAPLDTNPVFENLGEKKDQRISCQHPLLLKIAINKCNMKFFVWVKVGFWPNSHILRSELCLSTENHS